jgi:dihydrofolate reductase
MGRLVAFSNVTLDGFFTGEGGDLGWTLKNQPDPEFDAFVGANATAGEQLLLGRITYEMMASYWPTPMATERDPVTAAGMNRMSKIVFSRSLKHATWANTRLVSGDLAAEVARLKRESAAGTAILGSGSIVSQLTQARLIDEYQFLVNPVILGRGRGLFDGMTERLSLRLLMSRSFGNGCVLASYVPAS